MRCNSILQRLLNYLISLPTTLVTVRDHPLLAFGLPLALHTPLKHVSLILCDYTTAHSVRRTSRSERCTPLLSLLAFVEYILNKEELAITSSPFERTFSSWMTQISYLWKTWDAPVSRPFLKSHLSFVCRTQPRVQNEERRNGIISTGIVTVKSAASTNKNGRPVQKYTALGYPGLIL